MSARNTGWRGCWLQAALLAALWLGAPGAGQAFSFDLTLGGDFSPRGVVGPITADKPGVTLTLDSLSMTPEGDLSLDNGSPGILFVNAQGMGVLASTGGGSKEISGEGAHDDEVLTFGFSIPASSVTLVLTQFDSSATLAVSQFGSTPSVKPSMKSSRKSGKKSSVKPGKKSRKKSGKKSRKKSGKKSNKGKDSRAVAEIPVYVCPCS